MAAIDSTSKEDIKRFKEAIFGLSLLTCLICYIEKEAEEDEELITQIRSLRQLKLIGDSLLMQN
ncbi:hypothetical protein V2J09_003328 [Rumex salicifolius]